MGHCSKLSVFGIIFIFCNWRFVFIIVKYLTDFNHRCSTLKIFSLHLICGSGFCIQKPIYSSLRSEYGSCLVKVLKIENYLELDFKNVF
jgi:hypothetical protein